MSVCMHVCVYEYGFMDDEVVCTLFLESIKFLIVQKWVGIRQLCYSLHQFQAYAPPVPLLLW